MNCRIQRNKPTATQRKALRAECVKEFEKLLELYNKQVSLQILHILRFEYGFGQYRLEQFAEHLKKLQIDLDERYEMGNDNIPWLCEKQLNDSGIDLGRIFKDE